jgi:hypothetical protein
VRQAVVVVTWFGGREPAEALLHSLRGARYPVYVVVNGAKQADPVWLEDLANRYNLLTNEEDHYELGAIRKVMDETDLDEWLLLQDTFEVKDQRFLADVFDCPTSVALGPTFFHYAGKWRRAVLNRMEIPVVTTKRESVHYEHTFSRSYWAIEDVWVFDPDFDDGQPSGFVERFGRLNMLLENDYYRKFKGNWGQLPL